MYVAGYFQGDIDALELLEVQATGFVEGDVKGARLNVHEGGVYKGSEYGRCVFAIHLRRVLSGY